MLKKGAILWVTFNKEGSIVCVISKRGSKKRVLILWVTLKKIQFVESYSEKDPLFCIIFFKFNFFDSCWKEGFNFYDSCWKEGFNSVSQIKKKKGSVLWVMLKRGSILWVMINEEFNSLSFLSVFVRKCSILWVIKKTIQCFESYQRKKRRSILGVIVEKKGSILRVVEEKIFASNSKKKGSTLWVAFKKNSILCVVLKKRFNSVRHIVKQGSIFWVILKREGSSHRVMFSKKVQFFDSNSKERFNSLSHIPKKRVQFYESCFEKEGSILWVVFQIRGFNSMSRLSKKKVQFFESYFK